MKKLDFFKFMTAFIVVMTTATGAFAQGSWECGEPTESDVIATLESGTMTISGRF